VRIGLKPEAGVRRWGTPTLAAAKTTTTRVEGRRCRAASLHCGHLDRFEVATLSEDGSYLTEFLLAKGYEVHGLKRRASSFNTDRVDHIIRDVHVGGNRFLLHYADLTDGSSLASLLHEVEPDEIYNLGAQSHVKVSFEIPEFTANVVANGALRLLEAMRLTRVKCRFYQASSSEMFGSAPPPQREATVIHPRGPYACAKVFGHRWVFI
jgi:GDPmannose 4,6-dehydratase